MNANKQFFHVCVRSEHGGKALTQHDVASWLWSRLKRSFPDALAAVLMPDHIHVLAPAVNEADARHRLAAVVSALRRSKSAGGDIVFLPTSTKGAFTDRLKLARQVRYIVLNPCRAGYARCPLQWLWTTHRDVMGTVIDPWIAPKPFLQRLGQSSHQHHTYVSGDPSTRVEGTPRPQKHIQIPGSYSLQEAVLGALAAARGKPADLKRPSLAREQFMALARHAGWRAHQLEVCELSTRTLRNYLPRAEPINEATLMCLGDSRLTEYLKQDHRPKRLPSRPILQKSV